MESEEICAKYLQLNDIILYNGNKYKVSELDFSAIVLESIDHSQKITVPGIINGTVIEEAYKEDAVTISAEQLMLDDLVYLPGDNLKQYRVKKLKANSITLKDGDLEFIMSSKVDGIPLREDIIREYEYPFIELEGNNFFIFSKNNEFSSPKNIRYLHEFQHILNEFDVNSL